ncbi:MAG: hypothetical protein ACKVT1_10210 [Dehalococcoidia bacterium]
MRLLITSTLVAAVLGGLAGVVSVRADEGDTATLGTATTLIGQQSLLVLEVSAPAGSTVEVDPAAPSWNGVEVVRVANTSERPGGSGIIHRLELTVAPFRPGAGTFAPAVNVVDGAGVTPRLLPPVSWTVVATVNDGERLELSPLPPPAAIDGAESALLRPAIAAGALAGVLVLAAGVVVAVRWLAGRPQPVPEMALVPLLTPDLAAAESLLGHDPVAAYRALALTVRSEISKRYGLPATALTTSELQSRMELQGIERWNARLVAGLLTECDAVVFAGYRPAAERRAADLNMAREIVEGAG